MSILKLSLAGVAVLLCVFLQSEVEGAMQGGPDTSRHFNSYFPPSANMLKALQYIQNLRQQAGEQPPTEDDARELLKYEDLDHREGQDSKDQKWLNALLKTLPQTRVEPKASLPKLHYTSNNRENMEEGEQSMLGDTEDYADYPKSPGKFGLMFEDEEPQESPSKRANEAAELQYTPQSLANLQSVLEELEKLRHQNLAQDQMVDWRDDRGNTISIRNTAYKDGIGDEQWIPVEERMEMEEVVNDSREEFDRSLDNSHSGNGNSKQSRQPTYRNQEDQDDFNKFMDDYLLNNLEKAEQSEEKRNEELNSKKRISQLLQNLDPIVIYKLMEISKKLQILPETLIEMLVDRKVTKDDQIPKAELEPELLKDLLTDEDKLAKIMSYNGDKMPASKIFKTEFPKKQVKIPDYMSPKDILNIIGLESPENQNEKHFLDQNQFRDLPSIYSNPGGRSNYIPSKTYKGRGNDNEELIHFLATKMLAQNFKQAAQNINQHTPRPEQRFNQGTYESVLQDYFDKPETEKSSVSKTQKHTKNMAKSPQRQEEDTLLEMSYLMPKSEKQIKKLYDKTLSGMK